MHAQLLGCDFSSSPSPRKQIVLAFGQPIPNGVQLIRLERFGSLASFSDWLHQTGDWLGGFDVPFGLPRELVQHLGWPLTWAACIRQVAAVSRADMRAMFVAFCDARPVGGKFAHRGCDRLAGSSPSMKWVNPPVAYMLHAAMPLMLSAGVCLPGLHDGDTRRVALEAYPGLLAREILGQRSYKSDERAKQNQDRLIARKDLLTALEAGQTRLAMRLKTTNAQRDALVDDPSGDALDAALCLVQAAWAARQGAPRFGLPAGMDPLEGWIVTA